MEFDIDLGKVGITPGGSWNVETSYERLTLITYNGQSFISRVDNQGVTPGSNPAVWQLVAAKGQDGSGGGGDGGGSVIPGTSDVIGLAFYDDGNLYWTRNGEWLLDPNGNMVRANAIDGQTPVAPNTSFKSIVFKRSNSSVDAPIGGSYASPVPEGWSDGVPSGKEQLWMSTRLFSSDGRSPQQAGWTTPVPVTDNEYMDYEFSSADNPGTPSKSSPAGAEQNPAWSDTADTTTIWMAMREVKNGAYAPGSSWQILRVKGEKGEDGTSVGIKGHLDDVSELPETGNEEGDGYIIDGDLWVWDGDSWEDAGPIQGPPGLDGQTPYVHIKYSNDGGQTFSPNNGETPGDWIGLYWDYVAEDSSNPATYTWKKWKGEDGFGYEYIFKLTATDTPPDVPGTSAQRDDYVPTGWTDNPGNVSAAFPYCWVCYRKKTEGVWGNWIGSSSTPGKAGLYSHYGKDGGSGRGIASIQEKYAVSSSGTNVPTSWSDTVPELTAVNRYLWNYEVITYTDGDSMSTPPAVIGTYGSGRGIQSITEYYLASASSSGITRNTPGWQDSVQDVSASKPYLWNYEVTTYTDGTSDISEPFVIGHFGLNGADGTPGIGITAVYERYLISAQDSGITTSTPGWSTTPPIPTAAKPYLWNYETMVYSDSSRMDQQPHIAGRYGKDGANGRGIQSVTNYYLATNLTNVTRSTSGWGTSPQMISAAKPYLWNYEKITYDDGENEYTSPVIIGMYGAGASDTSFLEEVFGEDNVSGEQGAILRNLLGVTGAKITTSTEGWSTTVPSVTASKPYLWNYKAIAYSNGDTFIVPPTVIAKYTSGRAISSVKEYYLASADSSGVTTGTSGWSQTVPSVTASKPNLWHYAVISYSNGESSIISPEIIGKYTSGRAISSVTDYYLASTSSNDNVAAMINASGIGYDSEHGRLMIAAGMNGVATQAGIDAAKFKVYEDGQVHVVDLVGVNVNVSGTVNAVAGTIGPFSIDGYNGLTASFQPGQHLSSVFKLTPNELSFSYDNDQDGGSFMVGGDVWEDDGVVCSIASSGQGFTALQLSGHNGVALAVTEGDVQINQGYLVLGVTGYMIGFKGRVYTVPNTVAVNMTPQYRSYFVVGHGANLVLPASPSVGEEYEIYVHDLSAGYDTVTIRSNSAFLDPIYDGVHGQSGQSLTLEGNYKYKALYNGRWYLTRN